MDEETVKGIEIDLSCPKCFKKTKKSIGWLSDNDSFTCTCGMTSKIDKGVLRDTIKQLRNVPSDRIIESLGE